MTSPAPRRGGRNLPAAIVVGAGLGGAAIVSLAFYRATFLVIVAAAVIVGMWELGHALRMRDFATTLPLLAAGGVAMLAAAYYGNGGLVVAAFAITALVGLGWRMRLGQDGFVKDATAIVFVLAYVPLLASFVALLLAPPNGNRLVLSFVIVTISSDIGGYAAGASLGRHALAPRISPKKTWEGLAGSVLCCLIGGVCSVILLLHGTWWVGLLLGAVAVAAATFGDLVESMLKRDLGIKDMSGLLPGHGGLMDRLDSLLATVPFVWLILIYLLPHT